MSKRLSMIGAAVALSLTAVACSDSEDSAESTTTAAAETTAAESTTTAAAATTAAEGGIATAKGDVFVTGSSTVEPISIKVGELAKTLSNGGVAVTVEGPGTGDGFKTFCAGGADISDASRAIKEEEAKACADAGIEFVELAVAIDGLTVATSPKNTAIECLDTKALYALLGPESEGKVSKWSDANALATELGSKYATLPDAPLVVSGPGEESGTYDSFVEFAIKKIAEGREQDDVVRADYSSSANDNLIVEGIEGADTSLGWVGYAFYAVEQARMKAIAIENSDGACVLPTPETISDGSYPFSRTLYIYVNKAKAAANPAVKAYVDLYLSTDGLAQVPAAGYVSLAADKIQASIDAWAAAGV
jgi:phosphate transport system substrate-binding protein